MGVAQAKGKIGDAVLFQQGGNDVFDALLLEDTRVAPQRGAPQCRADHHAVTGLVQAGVALFKARHHAGDAALQHPFTLDLQRRILIQHRGKVDGRIGTGQAHVQHER
ncbi:hypothetical protein D3C73_216820 [compost metagenome]